MIERILYFVDKEDRLYRFGAHGVLAFGAFDDLFSPNQMIKESQLASKRKSQSCPAPQNFQFNQLWKWYENLKIESLTVDRHDVYMFLYAGFYYDSLDGLLVRFFCQWMSEKA